MEQFARLGECNGMSAQIIYASDKRGDDLRRRVRDVCASEGTGRLVCNFSRAALGQTGEGHFSPIAAYHEKSDSVLILDVARFKYPPFWVPLRLLWRAMLQPDPETELSRGWVVLKAPEM